MQVTDEQVETLRALLSGQFEDYKRLFARLDNTAVRSGYAPLAAAAFYLAAQRRFSEKSTKAEVINFVADVRSRAESARAAIDPNDAERIIRAVHTDEDITDIDRNRRFEMQLALLAGLVSDEAFDQAALASFLTQARKVADQMLA